MEPSATTSHEAGPTENPEHVLLRRHRLELALFVRLPATCRRGLAAAIAGMAWGAECVLCHAAVDRTFRNAALPEDEAVERACHHLAGVDDCDGACELRRAEAERLLDGYEATAGEPAPDLP